MKSIAILSIILFLFSCQEVKFKEPQPIETAQLSSFPAELIGSYYDSKSTDTLIIKSSTFRYGNTKSLIDVNAGLSDSVILKMKDNTYFLNLFDKENKLWNLVIFKLDALSNLHFSTFSIENNEQLEKIKKITPLQSIFNNEQEVDFYIAEPTEAELKKIIDQHLFSQPTVLNRIIKR